MACEMICDGCGKREKASEGDNGYFKPKDWYQRTDEQYGILLACSRECIKVIEERTGTKAAILPF